MSSPPSSNFGDSLLCPVCFIMFDGRILQCSQGHSVCEKCHKKLSNECPQCRSSYVGTRNYILEEMVKQLKHLKQISISTTNETDKTKPTSSGATGETGATGSTAEHPEVKLASFIQNFLASIPKPPSHDDDDDKEDEGATAGPISDTTQEERTAFLDVTGPIDFFRIAINLTVPTVTQAKGLFQCRMLDCTEKLPICRLLNHLRSFHNDHLMQAGNDEEFIMHWSFPCNSYRHAVQIPKFGLFFFIVNVKKMPNKTEIAAWVQCACPNNDARKFTFKLELRVGNSIASFSDFAYGASSDAEYIQSKKQCLTFETNQMAKKIKELAVDIKIYKTPGPQSVRRKNTTTVQIIPTATTAAENQSQQQQTGTGRSRNRRHRH